MSNLAAIEAATKQYADNRELLVLRVQELNDAIEALKREHLPGIKEAAQDTANARQQLADLIDAGRDLFTRPRTIIISGIKVGLQKGRGKIDIPDQAVVINLIRKHIPEAEQALYIETVEKVIKKNLNDLPVATLKKLGVKVEETGDAVLIKATDSDIDKMVNAMLKEGPDEDEYGEAA